MKTRSFLLSLLVLILLFASCSDKRIRIQTFNVPVYLTYDELRKPVTSSQSVSLQKPGKIYIKQPFIFINEYLKGIHVIDNTDPFNPQPVGFIEIPGNVDMAVRGSILYADSYVDLVALDISDPQNITETGRAKDLLPYIIPPTDNDYAIDWDAVDASKGVVVDWKTEEVKKEVENPHYPPPYPVFNDFSLETGAHLISSGGTGGNGGNSTGTGGSMARFTIAKDYLWVLTSSNLFTIDISDPRNMLKKNTFNPGWNLETIFPYDNYLFLGSQTGMVIYDISDPLAPEMITQYSHIRSCDPVVVQNDVAYVTLRNGSQCGGTENRMEVINLYYMEAPVLHKIIRYDASPYGLAVNDSLLYVCRGQSGLDVFDVTAPLDPVWLRTLTGIHGWDAIALDDLLWLIGDDGLYQYQVNSLDDIRPISSIPVIVSQ